VDGALLLDRGIAFLLRGEMPASSDRPRLIVVVLAEGSDIPCREEAQPVHARGYSMAGDTL
jgi:hypothetical protein